MPLFGPQAGLWWADPPKLKKRPRAAILAPDVSHILAASEWLPPAVLPDLPARFALDLEGYDPGIVAGTGSCWPKRGQGEIVGVAVATADTQHYIPFGHRGGDNAAFDEAAVWEWLRFHVKRPGCEIVFAHANYDLGWLARYGCTPTGRCYDVQIEAALLDENRFQYGLDSLARDFLGVAKDEGLLRQAAKEAGIANAKGAMHLLPARYVGPYAEQDARLTYDLHEAFVPKLVAEDLGRVWELETDIIPQVVEMRRRGVRVDAERAVALSATLAAEEDALVRKIFAETRIAISAWDNEAIAKLLQADGHKLPLTTQGRASVTKDILAKLPGALPETVRRIRKLNKVRSTFIEGYVVGMQHEGRIHAEFAQLRRTADDGGNSGTVSGRFSSDSPNLQNIPSDKEFGKLVRGLFLPEEGQLWASADYASQEPRWLVHFAALSNCRGAWQAVREFHANRKVDYHQMTADITGLSRKEAKAINLGITYGMKGKTFCLNNNLPTQWMWIEDLGGGRKEWHEIADGERDRHIMQGHNVVEVAGAEGKRMLDTYHRRLPFVNQMIAKCTDVATRRGYILTYAGRRCRFRTDNRSGDRIQTHAALNRLCQGSSADQTKYAMRCLWSEGVVPLLTEHDELCFSVPDEATAQHYAEVMENAVSMEVPAVCDVAIGESWGDCGD